MEIVTTHLTRMSPGYVCVAGVEPDTSKFIRPVLDGRLPSSLEESRGGPFALGSVVDLAEVVLEGHPPEVEDHRFDPAKAKKLRQLSGEETWELLSGAGNGNLRKIFGDQFFQWHKSAGFEYHTGAASLGHLLAGALTDLFINDWGKLRARLVDDEFDVNVSVTDVRFYTPNYSEVIEDRVENIRDKLEEGMNMIVSVGVGRPFAQQRNRHCLQVNNIYPEDDPLWS